MYCRSLRCSIKLLGVKIIKKTAFFNCCRLTDVEFGDKLQTIGEEAFSFCSLRRITMPPSVRAIGRAAFVDCRQLTDLELPEGLETIGEVAFGRCEWLRRITMPLKDGLIENDAFLYCPHLTTVVTVGGMHKTIDSLHLDSWRNEMTGKINLINQTLPNTESRVKTRAIQEWITSVIHRLNHYKAEHKILLREATTLLELALWKANLDDNKGGVREREGVRTTRGQRKRARKEICVTSGASIVIKNVLPFLHLLE